MILLVFLMKLNIYLNILDWHKNSFESYSYFRVREVNRNWNLVMDQWFANQLVESLILTWIVAIVKL